MKRNVPADGETMGCGEPDAKSGEAAGTTTNKNMRRDAAGEQGLDHRHQSFGMAATDQLVACIEARAKVIEQCGAACRG